MMTARLLSSLFLLTFVLVSWFSASTSPAQTTDYLYGIQSGSTPALDVAAISVNGSGTATSYVTSTVIPDLSAVSGFTAPGGGAQNVVYNALALDPGNLTLFFTVSYNDNGDPTHGNFTATSYGLQNTAGTWHATQIFNLTQAAALADNPGTNNMAATPASATLSDGWFTKGAFHNGSYWVGVDGDVNSGTRNSLYQITLGNGDNSLSTSQSIYSNISHGGGDASRGGDFVFDNSGNFYMVGLNTAINTAIFAKQSLANAQMANDNGSNMWNQNTSLSTFYQLGGLGQGPQRLYAGDSSNNLYQVTNFTNPSASAPVFSLITPGIGSLVVSFNDLADALLPYQIVPESKMWIAGAFPILISIIDVVRRLRKKRHLIERLSE